MSNGCSLDARLTPLVTVPTSRSFEPIEADNLVTCGTTIMFVEIFGKGTSRQRCFCDRINIAKDGCLERFNDLSEPLAKTRLACQVDKGCQSR